MQASNLKVSLITACCFVVALCSDIKCMDTASDIQEATSYKIKNNHSESSLDILKPEADIVGLRETLLPRVQDEDVNTSTSWGSYISSPVKYSINITHNIVDFAVKHPTQTVITSLLIAAQFATACMAAVNCSQCAICECYCTKGNSGTYDIGKAPDMQTCFNICDQSGWKFYSCN